MNDEWKPGITLLDDLQAIVKKLRYIGIEQLKLQAAKESLSATTACDELLAVTYESFLWTVKIMNELVKLGC